MVGAEKNSFVRFRKPTTWSRIVADRGDVVLADVRFEQKARKASERPSLFLFTAYFIYKNLYYLGVRIMRQQLRYRRRWNTALFWAREGILSVFYVLGQWADRFSRDVSQRIRAPFQRIGDVHRQQMPYIQAARAGGEAVLPAYLPVAEAVGRFGLKILATIFNYTMPVLAGWFLLTTVNSQLVKPYGLLLEYNGEQLGYISNEASFEAATQIVRDRVTTDSSDTLALDIPSLTLVELERETFLGSEDLADMLISATGSDIEEAFGLYIDNAFYGAVTDKDAIINVLDGIAEQNKTGKPDERVEFVRSISLKPGFYPAGSMKDADSIISTLTRNVQDTEEYEVQSGDTPTGIAQKLNIRYSQLKAMNPEIEDELKPGMKLKQQVARPFLEVKTIYTDVYEESIPYETVEIPNAVYAKSYREVDQEGADGLQRVTAEVTVISGVETNREVVGVPVVLRPPVDEKIIVGVSTTVEKKEEEKTTTSSSSSGGSSVKTDMTGSSASPGSSGFIWPTVGGHATTYRNHSGNGVDIAVPAGTPVFAAKSGKVVKVVNGYTGYGKHIVIDHGDGFTTLYAHNSDMYVSVGDYVGQGQTIAAVGRTGWATGNHVHFEVHQNGKYMYPVNYIGTAG